MAERGERLSPERAEATIVALQAAMASRQLTSRELVEWYLARVEALDRGGPRLNAVLETNPEALDIAAQRDDERRAGRVRGPLHGIPILLKDNVNTADHMMTAAGSLALLGAPAGQDATVAARLREAGAILLGKTNMSEWANFRSSHSSSGWCGRNGQSRNAYAPGRSPSGSSSGSAVAVAAALCAAALATETDGSIVSPAAANGVVGLKPSVGLVSRAGVVPIAHSQDTVGVHSRTVSDAAAVLTALAAAVPDPRDPATQTAPGAAIDYTRFLDQDGLRGARVGIARNLGFGGSERGDAVVEAAIGAMRDAGCVIVDPAPIPSDPRVAAEAEMAVLQFEFKAGLNAYLATRRDVALDREGFPLSLAGLIRFNEAHAREELAVFGQDLLLASEARGPLSDPTYLDALETSRRLSGPEGLDRVMDEHALDALVAPTGGPAWLIDPINGDSGVAGSSGPAARAGYPLISVPAGFVSGLPIGLTFMGRRFSEATLIRLAYSFERHVAARRPPHLEPVSSIRLNRRRGVAPLTSTCLCP